MTRMRDSAVSARDRGLQRASHLTRWLVAGSVVLSGAFTFVVAMSQPGRAKTPVAATTPPATSSPAPVVTTPATALAPAPATQLAPAPAPARVQAPVPSNRGGGDAVIVSGQS